MVDSYLLSRLLIGFLLFSLIAYQFHPKQTRIQFILHQGLTSLNITSISSSKNSNNLLRQQDEFHVSKDKLSLLFEHELIEYNGAKYVGVFNEESPVRYNGKICDARNAFIINPEQKPFCMTDNLFNGTTITNNKVFCGGVPLIPGYCFRANQGEFVYKKPSIATNVKNLCKDQEYNYGNFDNDNNDYKALECEFYDSDPRILYEKLKNRVVTFIGASHQRQIFNTLISSLRNEKYIVESTASHAVKFDHYFLRYEFNPLADDLRQGTNSENITKEYNKCILTQFDECAIIYFIWSTNEDEQIKTIKFTLPKLQPDVVITTQLWAYGKAITLSDKYFYAYEELYKFHKFQFLYIGWLPEPIKNEQIFNYLANSKTILHGEIIFRHCFHKNIENFENRCFKNGTTPIYTQLRTFSKEWNQKTKVLTNLPKQLRNFYYTFHTTCKAYDYWDIDIVRTIKINAYGECDSVIDRAISKTIMTKILLYEY